MQEKGQKDLQITTQKTKDGTGRLSSSYSTICTTTQKKITFVEFEKVFDTVWTYGLSY